MIKTVNLDTDWKEIRAQLLALIQGDPAETNRLSSRLVK
jgi:hypothetical protein